MNSMASGMGQPLLTFELTKEGDCVEIHADPAGLKLLLGALEKVLRSGQHEHLMTPSWGGSELSEDKQGQENRLIDHVKIMLWTSGRDI